MDYSLKINKILNQTEFLPVISKTAEKMGFRVYIVGGFVRDIILDRGRNEIDFLVIGKGVDFAKKLASVMGVKTISTFRNFGTAHFNYGGFDLEFVGARRESYNRGSRKPVVEEGTFEDDIYRRDFTINSIAVSLNQDSYGEIIDIFGGIEDIEKKIIRTNNEPKSTFSDDPLRILRACRFAAQLSFEIEEAVLLASAEMADRLNIISAERIASEFVKIMQTEKPSIGLDLLYRGKVLDVVFPELANLSGVEQRKDYHHKDVFKHTLEVVDNICRETDDVWLRMAALLHDIAKPQTKRFVENIGWTFHGHEEIGARMIEDIFRRMKFPLSKVPYVEKLVRLHLRPIVLADDIVTDSAVRRFIVAAGEDLEDLIKLCRADITSKNQNKVNRYLKNYEIVVKKVIEVKELDQLRSFQSPVRGDEIMRICNIPPSPQVGKIKKAIEEAILEGIISNTYEDAINYLNLVKEKKIN